MDGPRDDHTSEVIQTEKTNIVQYDLYVESKKKRKKLQMNLFSKQKEIHRHRKQPYGYERGKVVGEG